MSKETADEEVPADIPELARQRGIRRLCHFTYLSSLRQVIADGCIKASAELPLDQVNDRTRADGHREYVCCSVTYPNVFLLDKFAKNLNDWCILLLRPELLGEAGIRFCAVNAASGWGRHVGEGPIAFDALFLDEVESGKRLLKRTARQPKSVPTDNQAEVLVPGSVPISFVFEIVLRSDVAYKETHSIIGNWPSTVAPPALRVESRMFSIQSYWDSGLFSDPLPIEHSN